MLRILAACILHICQRACAGAAATDPAQSSRFWPTCHRSGSAEAGAAALSKPCAAVANLEVKRTQEEAEADMLHILQSLEADSMKSFQRLRLQR